MVIDLRALSTRQINFSVLPQQDLAACRYKQANNENKNLNQRRHNNLLTVCMAQILAR
jgi:hypothetical protein